MNLEHLYKLINNSNLTLIGYFSTEENIKDSFISKMNPYHVGDIDSSFSVKSYLRDMVIDTILSENSNLEKKKFLLIDFNRVSILPSEGDSIKKAKIIRSITFELRSNSSKYNYSPIVITNLYRSMGSNSDDELPNFYGGSGTMYASDLVIIFKNNKISVVKNRYGNNFDIDYQDIKDFLYI